MAKSSSAKESKKLSTGLKFFVREEKKNLRRKAQIEREKFQ